VQRLLRRSCYVSRGRLVGLVATGLAHAAHAGSMLTFVHERLMSRLQGLGDRGFPNPPDVKEFPVHNFQVV
jgi:hypothetical protein